MPKIRPFQGFRYNSGKIKKMTDVLAPPYDVISKKEQEAFHRRHPQNVIRLILGKESEKDTAQNNKYTRAGQFLKDWIKADTLRQDSKPAIYIYLQNYKEEGKLKSRLGFMAAMKIDEASVLRHENTLASPKKDRMALLKEVETNLSPIFGLFEDPKAKVQKLLQKSLSRPPAIDVSIDGVRHCLFVEDREEILRPLAGEMLQKPMFIADGHHRFEVACQFKNWMQAKQPREKDAGWHYVMTYFSDCLHNPFKIFPTHRLLRVSQGKGSPLALLSKRGKLESSPNLKALLAKLSKNREEDKNKSYRFGVFTKKEGFFIFTLNGKYAPPQNANPVEKLDVAALHKALIEPCFGIKAIEKSNEIDFTRDALGAFEKVKKGEFNVAVFLRPTSLKEMLVASKKGLKMPQKSTYFYPKLLSGLVFHKFQG